MKKKSHKRGASSNIQVTVSDETRDELKKLKGLLGLPSVDSVIRHLLANLRRASEPPEVDSSPAAGVGGAEKRRRVDVREPLYSVDVLTERRDMLEYYTGLDESAFRELLRRLKV